ncbi:MAG: MBL fold metallo-hydrolase [Clostridiales bacterium]|nr:MBL fold metallo-hydrolase [Clostridiales bacterium]
MIHVECLSLGPLGVNCYIVRREESSICVIIDAPEARPALDYLRAHNLTAAAILLTHGHFDHILGLAELKSALGAKVYVHALDAAALEDDAVNLAALGATRVPPCAPDVILQDGDLVQEAGMVFETIHTPGHTPGGVCYAEQEEKLLFTGDTLFRLSMGRADFLGSDDAALERSLLLLTALPGDWAVYPGHMRETTLAFERERNPFLRRLLNR